MNTTTATSNEREMHMSANRFQKRFFGGAPVYVCASCKHNTRTTDKSAADLDLCALCYEEAGIENEHNDGYHTKKSADCYLCFPGKVLTVKQIRENQAKKATGTTAASVDKKEAPMATQKTETVASLIKKLQTLKDKSDSEGRKIRRALRALGHKGGVRKSAAPTPAPKATPAKSAKAAKPAPKKAKAAPTKDTLVGQGGSDAPGQYRGD
jgi:hypothetical protein